MLNYSLSDLISVTVAFLLFPLFVFVPGYVFGAAFDIFRFRERTPLIRVLFSVIFSISATPILVFNLARISSTALWAGYAALWLGFVALMLVPRFPKPYGPPSRKHAWGLGMLIAAGLAGVLCLSLIDVQIGNRLYFSMSSYDYNFRAAVINSIVRRGIPPVSPFLHPGHDVLFRYHYFWFLVCSMVGRLGGSIVSARQAQIAGTAWVGIGLCATVALYLRFFDPQGPRQIRKRTLGGLILLAVSGLDIFPVLMKSISSIAHHRKLNMFGSAEWWSSDPVTSWIHALLWVPHHVAGVIACLTGFLILWDAAAGASLARRAVAWFAAGLAFASAPGLSIHVTFAFGCGMLAWGIVTLWHRWFWRTADLAAAGVLAVLLVTPYLLGLLGGGAAPHYAVSSAGNVGAPAAIPLKAAIRQFGPMDAWLQVHGAAPRVLAFADLAALPLNYLLEFGFFAIVAVLFLRQSRLLDSSDREYRLAVTSIGGTVLLVCTFVRSTVIGNNDLGWRGILIAQFLLLIVAVNYLPALRNTEHAPITLRPFTRRLLILFFWIGLMPSCFELFSQRLHPILMDAAVIAPDSAAGEETGVGVRTAALRQVYDKLKATLSQNAIVQHNPSAMQDMASGLYADRQRVLMGSGDFTGFGGDAQEQEHARVMLLKVFSATSTEADLQEACRALSISAIVVKDNDPVWMNKQSWVWNRKPLVDASSAKAFGCAAGKS